MTCMRWTPRASSTPCLLPDDPMPKIALVQMTSAIDPHANAETLAHAIDAATAAGAEFILSPEMTGLMDSNKSRMADNARPVEKDLTIAAARDAAHKTGAWILVGSIPVPLANGYFANRSVLINNRGDIVTTYDKLHLFDVDLPSGETYRESATYQPGTLAKVVQTPFGKLGLTICYDLRFPHLHRSLAQAGADMIAAPAAFTRTTGQAHWHTLLRARAIETGCFLLAPAQTGTHDDGRSTFGHSLAVSPWGDILCDMGTETGIGCVDLDLSQVAEARARIPAWSVNPPYEMSVL
jgi:deaminated glutathione amidase